MASAHLESREKYEDRYDRVTIELCRDKETMLRKVFSESKTKDLPKGKDGERQLRVVANIFHYFEVDMLAGSRWERRTETIAKWMAEDEARDQRLNEARLVSEPKCEHCGKSGLRIISKDLMSRGKDYDHREVLFMLECGGCNKRTVIWEDGSQWEHPYRTCPKCSTVMKETSKRKAKLIVDIYTCPKCQYSYQEELDLSFKKEKEKPDPYWEEDKLRFVLNDEQGKKYLEGKRNLEQMKQVTDRIKERTDNKAVYDAVANIQKVNIGQLTDVLQPVIEKAGYIELTFDKPEISRDVFVGFNCLDGKGGRDDYSSRTTLKKTVQKALVDTNWRLMSDGISYRLGYLSGRLRAYEKEEDLVELVKRDKKIKSSSRAFETTSNAYKFKGKDGRDIYL
jgi:DNA-directed RNA polymerase subunit M/transcription elongation factor TFIIS